MFVRGWLLCLIALTLSTLPLTVQAQPRAGAAALFKAAESGNVAEIKRILGQGVAANVADGDGWTALMVAAAEGKLPAAQALVAAGADVNWASKSGETPLMAAALSGHIAVVRYLLSEGADKTARTAQGLTAADIAARAKKPELVKLLQVAGARPPPAPADATPAAAADPRKEIDAKINAAADAFRAGRHENAAKLFQEVVALDPQHALAWHFLGQSLASLGKKDDARSAFEKSLALQATGTLAERNTKMLADLSVPARPNLPFTLDESIWKALESSEMYRSLGRQRPARNSQVKRVTSQNTGSNTRGLPPSKPYTFGGESIIEPLGERCTKTTTSFWSDVSGEKKHNPDTVSFSCGFVALGWSSSGKVLGTLSSLGPISGSLIPPRIGAEQSIIQASSSNGIEVHMQTICRITGRVEASQFDARLSGTAWIVRCRSSTASKGLGITNSSDTEFEDVMLENYGMLMLSRIGEVSNGERVALPKPGYVSRFVASDPEHGSITTNTFLNFEWSIGEASVAGVPAR